jgi:hypothetical protein
MQQLAIIVPLKAGAGERAAGLLADGPPFDLEEAGFERHAVEWSLDDLVDDPFHPLLQQAFDRWSALADGRPRVARTAYAWTSPNAETGAARGT